MLRSLTGMAVVLFILTLNENVMLLRDSGVTLTPFSSAIAQAQENVTVTSRVKRWTRTRLEAAKKHWAEDQQRFSECVKELDDLKAKSEKRMSYHRQGHLLEKCMMQKH